MSDTSRSNQAKPSSAAINLDTAIISALVVLNMSLALYTWATMPTKCRATTTPMSFVDIAKPVPETDRLMKLRDGARFE